MGQHLRDEIQYVRHQGKLLLQHILLGAQLGLFGIKQTYLTVEAVLSFFRWYLFLLKSAYPGVTPYVQCASGTGSMATIGCHSFIVCFLNLLKKQQIVDSMAAVS